MAKPRGLYTPVYASLPRHAKVRTAAKALRCDRVKLVGHLVCFWTWCLGMSARPHVLSAGMVAFGAEWRSRNPRAFAEALADAGIIDRVDGGYVARKHVHEMVGGCNCRSTSPGRLEWAARGRRLRPLVIARDGARCNECGATDSLEIDHIVALARGGTNDIDNLQVLCKPCNRSKGAR